jgi:hypothetical protein
MTKKTSKLAAGVLSALLYTQAGLGFAGVTLVALKDRMHAQPASADVASVDADAANRR